VGLSRRSSIKSYRFNRVISMKHFLNGISGPDKLGTAIVPTKSRDTAVALRWPVVQLEQKHRVTRKGRKGVVGNE
jgi:hypothetical protein